MRRMEWYYTRDGERQGPVEEAELFRMGREGRIAPDDYVWNETMGQAWRSAGEIPGLCGTSRTTSPSAASRPGSVRDIESLRPGSPGASVSCTAPVGRAWQRMKALLFAPFDIGKWFIVGFTAWLAALGEGGASFGGPQSSRYGNWEGVDKGNLPDLEDIRRGVEQFLDQYGGVVGSVAVAVVLVGLVLGLLILWVRARGKFMFLDNVVHDRALVSEPWHEFTQHGRSLFLWSLGYGIICALVAGVLIVLTVVLALVPCLRAGAFVAEALPGLAFALSFWAVFGLVTAYIGRFLEDFVIPIMYHEDKPATEAWARFLGLFRSRKGGFIVYGLFYFVLSLAAGVIVFGLVLITCCVAGCVMAIPYLGAVVMLPFSVFFRAYSLEYLAQFGTEFRLFPEGAAGAGDVPAAEG